MPRASQPYVAEPKPKPPDPAAFEDDDEGLAKARRVYKRAYDKWMQRRRRAAARGENLHARPSPPMPTAMPVVPVQAVDPSTMRPTMMLMIPASMMSLLPRES